jgi:hypothetical protein
MDRFLLFKLLSTYLTTYLYTLTVLLREANSIADAVRPDCEAVWMLAEFKALSFYLSTHIPILTVLLREANRIANAVRPDCEGISERHRQGLLLQPDHRRILMVSE